MCKTKSATDASDPIPTRPPPTHSTPLSRSRRTRSTPTHSPRAATPSTSAEYAPPTSSTSSQTKPSSSSYTSTNTNTNTNTNPSSSSRTSLSSLRESISDKPHIYSFDEIRSATNNFLLKKYSSSSSSSSSTNCWQCLLRGRDVIIFQRKFRRKLETQNLRERLSVICRSHHNSIIKLLGASISDDYIYLVYEFIYGANLSDCLRNPRNPEFTVLSSWMSRMQIATDLAHGLDYIHNNTGLNLILVHNRINSSSIVVTEPSFNAKICHFGTAQLCGETDDDDDYERRRRRREVKDVKEESEITEEVETTSSLTRSSSGKKQFEGVRGYISPELGATGIPTQKSDVYALGVVILELLSGEEPLKFKKGKTRGEFTRTSVIDTARLALMDGGDGGRLRMWMDRRLKDSFPVDVAESVTRVALECVDVDPDKRPDMKRVSQKISMLYLASLKWSESIKMPTDISVSLAPRP